MRPSKLGVWFLIDVIGKGSEYKKEDIPINENEIRITSHGLVRSFISRAATLLLQGSHIQILDVAMASWINTFMGKLLGSLFLRKYFKMMYALRGVGQGYNGGCEWWFLQGLHQAYVGDRKIVITKKLTHLSVNANGCPVPKDVVGRGRFIQENLKIVASEGIRDTGAIASSQAAEIYGRDILAQNVQVIEASLPKAPLDTAFVGRWLAIEGVQHYNLLFLETLRLKVSIHVFPYDPRNSTARIILTVANLGTKPAPTMAIFSSKGPNVSNVSLLCGLLFQVVFTQVVIVQMISKRTGCWS
ncbi:hypothetical protein Tco_0588416 [Tanacetum coccineum]